MNSVENNNNNSANIRNKSDEIKVNFIKNVLSQTGIPQNFIALPKSNENKIFFGFKNDETQRRDYILFENNTFYCVFCLCFSPLAENSLTQGVKYVPGCRITTKLGIHDNSANHQLAQNVYAEKSTNLNGGIQQNSKRNVLRIVLKIIIFLATHGKFSIKSKCKKKFFDSFFACLYKVDFNRDLVFLSFHAI